MFRRIILTVLDSVGVGALPDAGRWGDSGANTLGNIARSQGGLFLPVMADMGLGNIAPIEGVAAVAAPQASHGKMAELSAGKDTTIGHWEMAGCPIFTPFPVYPGGFPADVTAAISSLAGREVLGNKAASGTEIIAELGGEHMATGRPIIYTSADSVLQIAAHEEVLPVPELNALAAAVRQKVCVGPHAVARVITRPFIGVPGNFVRTANRHDFSLEPPGETVLDALAASGRQVAGVGKISDIFAARGITASFPAKSNDDGVRTICRLLRETDREGLIFANLVEFDSMYGHRNDSRGYALALQRFDGQLALMLDLLAPDDLLLITADHGCDPTMPGTDHTREYTPLLAYAPGRRGRDLGVRESFADIAATVAENFSLPGLPCGRSFLHLLGERE